MPNTSTTVTFVTFEEVAFLDGMEDTIKAMNEAKKMIKHFEGLKSQAESALRAAMGSAKIGTINGTERVVISSRTRTGVNAQCLMEIFPEAYELTRTETEYTVLTTK
jgi:hypothetical protein